MKRADLGTINTNDLVKRFVEIGIEQYRAIDLDDNKKYNQLFSELVALREELKRRPGDQRRTLMVHYTHPNMQVRLNAAKATLAVAPLEARAQLQAIYESNYLPQSGDAGMSLWCLENGIFKPT